MTRGYMHGSLSKPSRRKNLSTKNKFGRQLDNSESFQLLMDCTAKLTRMATVAFSPPAPEELEVKKEITIGFTMKDR